MSGVSHWSTTDPSGRHVHVVNQEDFEKLAVAARAVVAMDEVGHYSVVTTAAAKALDALSRVVHGEPSRSVTHREATQ